MSARKATNSALVCRAAGFAEHATVLSVKGRVQRERTVAAILKAVTFGPSGRQRQHWIKAVKCLNRRLSSTQKTTAWEGGLRYSPIMSAALTSNFGSFDAM